MSISNAKIASILTNLAKLLELQGANPFRIRAYYKAAYTINKKLKSVETLVKNGEDLTKIPWIGRGIANIITEIIDTGKEPDLTQHTLEVLPTLKELLTIKGIGLKRARLLHKNYNIQNKNDLRIAFQRGQIQKLKGFGQKLIKKIQIGLNHPKPYVRNFKIFFAIQQLEPLISKLKLLPAVKKLECASSYRRRQELVGNINILVIANNASVFIKNVISFPEIKEIVDIKKSYLCVRIQSGLQLDFHLISQKTYGAALIYYTGSNEHITRLEQIASKKKYRITKSGIYKSDKILDAPTEEEIYNKLGLAYITPELRENRGEIEAAIDNTLPNLIKLSDIRGDLHCHTAATDGKETIQTMANAALERGYEYLAITDHSQHLKITNGLNEKRLFEQIRLIDKINNKMHRQFLLKSIEVDILEDGTLDLSNDVLKELDLRVCSIHYKFNLPLEKQTERIIRAMDNPYFNILAHPTGRLINSRNPYKIDLERILFAAKERNCIIELNSQPARLDLNDVYSKKAKEIGLKFAISSDAHSIDGLSYIQLGVYQARRAWLEPKDVINTSDLNRLKLFFNK